MAGKASAAELDRLHGELAKVMLVAIKPEPVLDAEGTLVGHKLNAALLSAARQFLKDNGVEGPAKPELGALAAALLDPLPFATDGTPLSH